MKYSENMVRLVKLKSGERMLKGPSILRKSITARIILISIPVIAVVSVIIWCPSIREFQKRELEKQQSFAISQADLISKALRSAMLRNDREHIQEAIESISGMGDTLWIRVADSKDIIKFSSKREEIGTRCPEECAELDLEGSKAILKEINGRRAILVSRPVENEKPCWTASCHFHKEDEKFNGRIELASDIEPTIKRIRNQGFVIASFATAFTSLLLFILYLIVRMTILKRVFILAEASRRVSHGELNVSVPVTEKDEIGQLSETFNTMVDALRKRKETMELELNGYRQSLIQAQKMEAIGLLATGIAHDFNNLLTGIIGFSELSLLNTKDSGTRENLKRIIETAEKGADLSRQILLIGRKVPPQKSPLNINVFVSDSFKMLKRMVEEKIELRTILKDGLPFVNADHSQLTQVLMNLVVNARDAIEGSGAIAISTDEVFIDESYCMKHPEAKPGHYVVLSVRDTGTGIPEDLRNKVFDPFFTTKEKGKGTGLGLSVTYAIVASHDGWISLYSEEGKGTEFKVYLPACEGSNQSNQSVTSDKPALPTAPDSRTLILLVDDEEMIRDVGGSILRALGYEVVTAANGKEAVNIYRERGNEISLIIMDLVMPVMDGETAFREIRKINPDVKVIISSGYSADRMDILRNEGVRGFFSKPYRLGEIANVVRKVLDEGS